MARNEQDCSAPKVIQEVNFPKYLWGFSAREGLLWTHIEVFSAASDVATADRQIPNCTFSSIS